ncbi:unnamed protein product [Urochloa decumbens]|uniref:Uncharacterized protein n=1 Tax=Urochloa decumbens TaxID=240449 RepID=A0ABC9EI36_9POAL
MDNDKVKKPLPATKTKKLPPSSWFLAEVRVLSLLAALVFSIHYGGVAVYNLSGAACRPPRVLPCYKLTGAAAVGEAAGLERAVLSCSAPQGVAAALALVLAGRRPRGRRALVFVALAAAGANHWMYARLIGLARVGAPGDIFLGFETAALFLVAGLDLLGFVAFLLGGHDE